MVCFRNICINPLHKGDDDDYDDNVCTSHKFIAQDPEDEHSGGILSVSCFISETSVLLKSFVWVLY
jgi:hypothetical protein